MDDQQAKQYLEEYASHQVVKENWLEREHDLIDFEKLMYLIQVKMNLPTEIYCDIRTAMDACTISKKTLQEMAREYEETGCNKGDACFS